MAPTRSLVLAALLALLVAPAAQAVTAGTAVDASAAVERSVEAVAGAPNAVAPGGADREQTAGDGANDSSARAASGAEEATRRSAVRRSRPAGGHPAARTALAIVEPEANTTNYLDISTQRVVQSGYAQGSVDVMGAVERDVAEIRSNYTATSHTYATADRSADGTVAAVRAEVDRIEQRIGALDRRYEQTLARYGSGEWTTDRTLRELAVIDAVARGIGYRLDRVDATVPTDLPPDLAARISRLELDLVEYTGPVRDRVGEAMAAKRDATTTYLAAAADGVVVSQVEGLYAYREAYLAGNRAETGENKLVSNEDLKGFRNAINRVSELYPWAWSNTVRPDVDIVEDAAYRFALDHPHGRLDLYLDGRTTQVFKEVQRPQLSLLPVEPITNVTDSLVLQVNRTYGTGPMEVVVTDQTGTPVNATVTVNDFRVGSTGSDGRLWTITPYADVRVVVETDDGRSVSVSFLAD